MSDPGNLGPQLESFVSSLVEAGRYGSRDDVLRDGVRLIENQDRLLALLALLDTAIGRGVADAQSGRVRPVSEVADRLTATYRYSAA